MTAGSAEPQLLCLGESMVLVTPVTPGPLEDEDLFRLDVAGAESTVALYATDLGVRAAWASRVGDDPLGRRVVSTIARHGVDTSRVRVDPEAPTGVFFKDPNGPATTVHYYRRGSAASRMAPRDLADLPLAAARIIHVSGVTAALSASCRELLRVLLARPDGVSALLSFDVNYRPGLWEVGQAAPVLAELARAADLVFVGQDEADVLWGTRTPAEVANRLGTEGTLVVKDGAIGATEISAQSSTFMPAEHVDVVESVGAGDAFAAGYLAGVVHGFDTEQRLAQAHRLAARALASTSDYVPNLPRPSEIQGVGGRT